MYAVIETGGKQYRVEPNQLIRVEKLDNQEGSIVKFDRVLARHDGQQLKVGSPVVAGATVTGKVVKTGKAPKVLVFKYRRRKDYHRKRGHRQWQTIVKITDIQG